MVISIAMLAAGPDPAGYYLARGAGCASDYYSGAGDRPGKWLGAGAAAAGLSGGLDPAGERVLRSLLDGQAVDGRVLVAPVLRADPRGWLPAGPLVEAIRAQAARRGVEIEALLAGSADRAGFAGLIGRVEGATRGRATTVGAGKAGRLATAAGLDPHMLYRTEDRANPYAEALAYAQRRISVRRAGIDVTVSAPKSVSILYGLSSPEVAAAVRGAHLAAVGEALAYLETNAGHGLRGHQGDGQRAARVPTAGWIVAGFEHRTSRTGDPQLHTHLVVPNLVRGTDGKWSAIDSRAVYRHALTASYLYHAVLRGRLTQRLGVAWTTPERGIAEIAGAPSDLIREFSTRRLQILTSLHSSGCSGPAAAQAACLATRLAKPAGEPEQTLRERWSARTRATGHQPGRVVAAMVGRTRVPAPPSIERLATHLLGPAGLTAQATGFDRRDMLQALCQSLPPGLPVNRAEIEAAADQVLRHRDTVRLVTGGDEGARWSTTELLGVERSALRLAGDLRTSPTRVVSADLVEATLADHGLTAEQQAMVRSLAAAEGLAVVVGPAGAGKTAALAAATQLWSEQGRPVIGGSVAAVTARRLEHATGIPSTSLARMLANARRTDRVTRRPAGLPRGGVLVIDEASMVDTRTLSALLAHIRAADGTVVLVGDPAQLPEIGAGGLFAAVARHPDTITLTDNRRQAEVWERRALADLRAGDPDAAVAAYAGHGRVHAAPGDELAVRVVDDYLRHVGRSDSVARGEGDGSANGVVMLAVRRADVTDLNDATRARLLESGRLGLDAVTIGQGDRRREYRTGDRVLVTVNDYRLGLLNGTRGVVEAVDVPHATMTLATDEHQLITVPVEWAARHLDHGYAMTCHKAQGATVEVALLYGAGVLTREAGYVALSRGRAANHLYVPDDLEGDRTVDLEDGRHLDRLAAQLAVRDNQTLATRQLPRTVANPWRAVSYDTPSRRVEGLYR